MKLRSTDVTWREIDGQSIILDLRSSTYLTTNASGTVLLRSLSQDCAPDDLPAALIEQFGIPRERAEADVAAFVATLRDKNLLDTAADRE
jgi:hypothetical protein